jgi:hypothetical protein
MDLRPFAQTRFLKPYSPQIAHRVKLCETFPKRVENRRQGERGTGHGKP